MEPSDMDTLISTINAIVNASLDKLTIHAAAECDDHLAQVWDMIETFYEVQDTHIDPALSSLLETANALPVECSQLHCETSVKLADIKVILDRIDSRITQANRSRDIMMDKCIKSLDKEEARFAHAQKVLMARLCKKLRGIQQANGQARQDQSRNETMLTSLISASRIPVDPR
ncbi:hypothetical protein O5D80_000139 [Batrachochytrium dendrobatidis]|nr:hypothetical protein O5D80_000139 [Batrachochytrium dendrobatidis]